MPPKGSKKADAKDDYIRCRCEPLLKRRLTRLAAHPEHSRTRSGLMEWALTKFAANEERRLELPPLRPIALKLTTKRPQPPTAKKVKGKR